MKQNKTIAIIGLGYVGLPLAVEFGKHRATLGFDINQTRINELQNGQDHTLECSPEELQSAPHLGYSANAADLQAAQIYIVTVPTPVDQAMGSNRASSFMASLVSNTGVLGALLFCSMLASLLWRYIKAPELTDMQIFVATALPTATLAMSLGIPDLNLPMYWGFIFLAFIFCPEPSTSKSGSDPN